LQDISEDLDINGILPDCTETAQKLVDHAKEVALTE